MDDADTVAQKIRKAKTDPEPLPSEVAGLAGRPGGRQSRRHLRRASTIRPRRRCSREFGGSAILRRSKRRLTDLIVAKLVADPRRDAAARATRPITSTRCWRQGAERAREIAAPVMASVKDILGLVR